MRWEFLIGILMKKAVGNLVAHRFSGFEHNRLMTYSTVTLLARFRGWSTSQPLLVAIS